MTDAGVGGAGPVAVAAPPNRVPALVLILYAGHKQNLDANEIPSITVRAAHPFTRSPDNIRREAQPRRSSTEAPIQTLEQTT